MKIIYWGTPDFAVLPLKNLLEHNFNVVAVVTIPDKSAGRGLKPRSSSVKLYAESKNLPVLQPETLTEEPFITTLRELNADLFVVVAFRILPEVVFSMPRCGTFNLHASLLPSYRGAAPINWAVINGETKTGVTTFFLNKGVDTGEIILQKEVAISDNDTAGTLHDKLMRVGSELLIKTCRNIKNKAVFCVKQSEQNVTRAPKLTKQNTEIQFTSSAKEIYNFVRGLNPYPAAWITLKIPPIGLNAICKIYEIETYNCTHTELVGSLRITPTSLMFYCKDGYISVKNLQIAGKKRMDITDWLRGLHLKS